MRSPQPIASLACAVVLLASCAVETYSTDDNAITVDNGQGLNGQGLNGQGLNGQGLNGQGLNGQGLNGESLGSAVQWVSLSTARIHHHWLDGAWLDGSQLVGEYSGTSYGAEAFAGATLIGRSDTGRNVRLRVVDVEAPLGGSDIWRYHVEYFFKGDWYALCEDAVTGPFGAIAVDGYWSFERGSPTGGDKFVDGDRFTFACPRFGAIGKCVELGYRPWGVFDGEALDAHHQACTRLMRADYCGDGTPNTQDGKIVNLYDSLGVQVDTEDWTAEAEWDAEGARCLSPHNRGIIDVPCYDEKIHDACGFRSSFPTGTLLISETPDPPPTP